MAHTPAEMGTVALCLAASLAAQPFDAAQRGPQPTFRAAIDLVQVDIVVVDKDGNPVRGLKAGDFSIFDRRKPQTIANFEEISHEPAPEAEPVLLRAVKRDVASNQTAQSGRLVVMVVDDLHIYKDRTPRAKEIARKVLTDLGAQSSMAVLFTSGEHSTQVTEDQAVLTAAVDTLKGRQSWRRPHPAVEKQGTSRIDPEDPMEVALAKVQQSQDTKLQDFFDNLTQYKTLRDAARLLGGGDARRKAFVLVSEGIGKDLTGLFGVNSPQGEPSTGGLAYGTRNDIAATMTVAPTGYHDFGLLQMMEAMRRSNVATYAIDPRGHVASGDLLRECFPAPAPGIDPCSEGPGLLDWVSPVRQAQHGLEIMSEASGGFAVTNTDDFTSGLKRIIEDIDHYYLLGFYPADTGGKGFRPLDVRVAGHPDWRLRFRRGYMPGGPQAGPKSSDPLVALSTGILPKTELPLRLTAVPFPGVARTAHVVLALEVTAPPRALQEADGKLRDNLKYEVLAVDEKKARVASASGLEGRLTLSPGTPGQAVPDTMAYQVAAGIDLPPGHYELRVSALSAKLAKGGSVYLDVDVPDFSAAPLTLSGIALGYADRPRVPAAPTSVVAPGASVLAARGRAGAPVAPAPSRVDVPPFPPSLDREFAASDTLRVYFEVARKNPAGTLQTTTEIVDASDHIVASLQYPANDRGQVDAHLALKDLPPGAYRLHATASDGRNTAQRDVGFVVK
jgi:VWFA-related protein